MSSTFNDAAHPEGLMRIMEAAPQVCRRHQFFVWTQSDLQRWLPHDLLLCGFYDREVKHLVFDVFNSRPLPQATVSQLKEVPPTWVHPLLAVWGAARQHVMTMSLGAHAAQHEVLAALHGAGYSEVLMHGHTRPGRPDEVESFFVFARQDARASLLQSLALDMLLPCLHAAYQRVCVTERQMVLVRTPSAQSASVNPLARSTIPITSREREILMWVRDGLSNHAIGAKLGISALTVKNHVQKILRKLGASNRTQAVAIAMGQDMLSAPDNNN